MEVLEHFGTRRPDIVLKSLAPKFVNSSCKNIYNLGISEHFSTENHA